MTNQDITTILNIFATIAPYALVWALGLRITVFVIGCMSGKRVKDV